MLQHQTNSQNNLTFLKSNYKYKRRNILTMRALPACCCVARTSNQLAATLSKTQTKTSATATAATPAPPAAAAAATTTACKCSTILSLFIVIIWKVLQAVANCLRYAGRIIANANDHEDAVNGCANAGHDHDVNATAVRHLVLHPQALPHSHTRTTHAEDDANDEVSTAREQQQQPSRQQQQHLSSSSLQKSSNCLTTTAAAAAAAAATSPLTTATSSATTTTRRVVMLSAAKSRLPLMTLLIALLLSMRLTSAGTCWQTHLGSGKCNKIFSTNITKSDCCGVSQTFSYTDRELSSVEYFFATAIGGGVECAPCIESCKGFKCGPNKKCVKRKGRPKCVCAPECGATLRRKHQLQQQQQQQQHNNVAEPQPWQQPKSSALLLSAMPPRGSRSLISEITNANLGLNGAKRQQQQQSESSSNGTDNQRNQQQQQQQMPMPKRASRRRGMLGETKHRRLLIIDSSNLQEQPTTRRLHMEGNGNGNSNGGRVQMQIKMERGTEVQSETETERERESEMEMERLAPIWGYDRRRHRKNNSSSSSNNGKHLTRSMSTLTSTTTTVAKATATATGANDSSSTTPAQTAQSRHKLANANEPANDITRQQQQQQQKDNAPARVRHQHQQQQQLAPNHEQQYDNGSQQRRHKHKHNHKDKPHTAAATAAAAEGILLTANTTMSGSGSGSGSGARRRLYLAEHGSETAASSGTSSGIGSGSSSSHLANTDDLTFLAGSYEAAPQQHHTNPVCGNDGRTYNTECQLRKRACRTNNAQLEVAYRGHCKTSCNGVQCVNGLTCVEDQYMMPHCIVCKIDCPWDDDESAAYDLDSDEATTPLGERQQQQQELQRRAVCGVDGKTYRSTCDINRMICKIGRSIAVAYPGPCRADHVTCADIKCGPKDTCLIDLRTHMPRCVSCRYKCSRKQQRTQFRADKICGYNNHTYNSWCEMRKDSCATGYFIGVRSTGVC
ncbi:hypothetical protein KR044_007352 [Drosophila immigrans]|nr:hypothetical protein KR044_007352 [Drosophila immigrans]